MLPNTAMKNGTGTPRTFLVTATNTYEGGGVSNFYHSIRNIDLAVSSAGNDAACGVHWKVAQGTSLRNMTIDMGGGESGCGHRSLRVETLILCEMIPAFRSTTDPFIRPLQWLRRRHGHLHRERRRWLRGRCRG